MLLKGFWMFQLSFCLLTIKLFYFLLKQKEWLQQTKSRFPWMSVCCCKADLCFITADCETLALHETTGVAGADVMAGFNYRAKWVQEKIKIRPFFCGSFCVVWSVCSLTHWTHYFDLAESISPTSLALESVKAGVCKLYWVKAEASGWVVEQGKGALFFRGLLLMHYIFSNSLNLENKQLQKLPSGICSTCVCVLLSFNASSPKFAPFLFWKYNIYKPKIKT